jgi:molybdopterin molybdotransferase
MFSVAEAEALILDLAQPLVETESVKLEAACDRVLAQTVVGQLDIPHWDNSAMDGYAVRYEDVSQASLGANLGQTIALDVIEEIPAGIVPQKAVQSGQAARIFTGAMMPAGADTVVMQENTERVGAQVKIKQAPEKLRSFVRQRGDYYQAGNPLLLPGIRLNAPEIAVLAAAQCPEVQVYRRLRVAILSTGDELVTPDQVLQPGQIVDSNQYALAAFVESLGAIAIPLGIAADQPELLQEKLELAIATADIVLSTGGVSVGDYDYVEKTLDELGANVQIRSVAIRPGKPLTVAMFFNQVLFFGIPGNPVSALVTAWRFVQPAIKKRSGLREGWQPSFLWARTQDILRGGGAREIYLWGRVRLIEGEYRFSLAGGSHSSANLINLAQTNALAVIAVGQKSIEVGDRVLVMLMGH